MRIDTLIGILWSFGMAVGIIFVYMTPGYAPNLTGYLFGGILTVSYYNLIAMGCVAIGTIFVFILLYREILYLAFDEEYATTRGLPVKVISFILLGLISLTIVISIRVVGIILVISLLTIPQATASLYSNDFKRIMLMSVFFAFFGCCAGLILSYFLRIPSGATIIFSLTVVFGLLKMIDLIMMRRRRSANLAQGSGLCVG
jgi:zinc transport system permease protein